VSKLGTLFGAGRGQRLLESLAAVSVIAVCITMIWFMVTGRSQPAGRVTSGPPGKARPAGEPALPQQPISLADAQIRGDRKAKIVLIEYSEFQCPFCGKFEREIWPALDTKYVSTGKLMLAFMHVPLESIHPFAVKAAQAADCAGNDGRFWEMRDLLFADQKRLDDASLRDRAATLKLDMPRFDECLAGSSEKVRRSAEAARSLGITGTPTFFVGIRQPDGLVKVVAAIRGAKPASEFEQLLDKLLAGDA
jgi:protein-disulfide isomerase